MGQTVSTDGMRPLRLTDASTKATVRIAATRPARLGRVLPLERVARLRSFLWRAGQCEEWLGDATIGVRSETSGSNGAVNPRLNKKAVILLY